MAEPSVPSAPNRLEAAQLDALRQLDTCALANAIEATGTRLRNEGYMNSTVRCLFPDLGALVGYALPLRVRSSGPPMKGQRYIDHIDWADRLLALPEPRVLVVEDVESEPNAASFMGEVHANIYRALGCAGVVTNGAVRDLPAVHKLRFPAFASHVAVSHAYVHVVDAGHPATVGGLTVHEGDLLHGDRHGVLSIPLQVAADLPDIVARQKAEERRIIQFCRSDEFSPAGLERLLQQIQAARPLP